MIAVECARCGDELTEPGALLFSPPISTEGENWVVNKLHLCVHCYAAVIEKLVDFRITDGVPEFESQGSFDITGRGRVFTVRAGEYANRVDELLGHQVSIDGDVWTVTGVERMGIRPYPEHYSMGLLVRGSNAL